MIGDIRTLKEAIYPCTCVCALFFLQVGDNGIISFNRGYLFWQPALFPTNDTAVREALIVAPFWGDTDTRLAGNIYYRLIEVGSFTEESDLTLLNFVSELVAAKGPESAANFSATAMLVAQWMDVPPYPHGASDTVEFPPSITQFIDQVSCTFWIFHIQLHCIHYGNRQYIDSKS